MCYLCLVVSSLYFPVLQLRLYLSCVSIMCCVLSITLTMSFMSATLTDNSVINFHWYIMIFLDNIVDQPNARSNVFCWFSQLPIRRCIYLWRRLHCLWQLQIKSITICRIVHVCIARLCEFSEQVVYLLYFLLWTPGSTLWHRSTKQDLQLSAQEISNQWHLLKWNTVFT